jgi:hypothetical protein
MRDSLSGLSAGAMQAASAALPACAFHAMTAFGLECGLAPAGATSTAASANESVKKRMKGTADSFVGELAGGFRAPGRDDMS